MNQPRRNPMSSLSRRGGRMISLTLGAVLAAFVLTPAPAPAARRAADAVLLKGNIRTFDAQGRVVEAMAIRDGRIIYAGTNAGAARFIGRRTAVQNLHGRTVMPGLQDAHLHLMWGGMQLITCNLTYDALTTAEFQARIQACLDSEPGAAADKWLQVVNWYRQAMQPAGTDADKGTLDALNTTRPIFVQSSDGHSALVNSRGLDVAGITAATPDPATGQIAHDGNGQPTGILEDGAQDLAASKIPAPTAAENQAAVTAALERLAAAGVTSVEPQQTDAAELAAYKAIWRKGKLTVRINAAPNLTVEQVTADGAQKSVRSLLKLRHKYETGPLRVKPGIRVRAAGELYQDGVIQAPAETASMLSPYFDANGVLTTNSGPDPYWPNNAVLANLIVKLVRAGFTPQVHAIGDRAVRTTLDVYQAARKKIGPKPTLAMAHAESVDPADYGRFKSLNVIPVMSFQWGKPGPDSIEAAKVFMGPERFDRMEPEGRLQAAGASISFGSDWPVDALNEFFALEVGVTRTNDPASGYTGTLNSDPGLTREQSFRAITRTSAEEMGTLRVTGSLEKGKFADFIVLDQDPMTVTVTSISDTKVLRTVVGGRTVYKAP